MTIRGLGVALVVGLLGFTSGCSIELVEMDEDAWVGSTVTATLHLGGNGADETVYHVLCIGLFDADARGWNAVATGWEITAGTGSPASGTPTRDTNREAVLDEDRPDSAPWRCYEAMLPITDETTEGTATVDIWVPGTAATEEHNIEWAYSANGYPPSTTSSILHVHDGVPVATIGIPDVADCPGGGAEIDYGYDRDGDGAFDNGIDHIYQCNPTVFGGAAGAAALISNEAAGENCEAGGLNLQVGFDDGTPSGTASNGMLEAGEVDANTFLCNRTDNTFTTATRTSEEAAGSNCEFGGTREDTGVDNGAGAALPNDGVLSDAEVDDTTFTCNEGPVVDNKGGGCAHVPSSAQGLAWMLLFGLVFLRRRTRSI